MLIIKHRRSHREAASGTRRPTLTDLRPVFSQALAKEPDDRYDTCLEFADALAKQLETVATETGATDATAVALPASGPRHRSRPQRTVNEPPKTHWKIVVAIVVALLLAVTAIALVLFAVNVI
jgi:serine/threonine protein kinase, bacterial